MRPADPMSSRLAPVMFASASEQGDSVRAGGGTPGRTLVRSPALRGEHEVDGVLGQHRDQREQREREPGRDVELRHLGRPRQQERRAHDREAEQHGLEGMRQLGVEGGGCATPRHRRPRRQASARGDRPACTSSVGLHVPPLPTRPDAPPGRDRLPQCGTMEWVGLAVSFVVILVGAELFTNGVEWIGEGFGLWRAPWVCPRGRRHGAARDDPAAVAILVGAARPARTSAPARSSAPRSCSRPSRWS